ncbi:MAG: accessory gene regulator B family protein [Lachnospiraceae bacterium]|nr:accessory gene regulator B family protein [Lachnospiraceae bacterium]
MEYFAEKLVDFILKHKVIEEEDYAIYKYGLQTGMETSLCVIVSAFIAVKLDAFLEYLVFVIMFFPLRAYMGGIHMKRFCSCFLCSCIVITVGLYLSTQFTFSGKILVLPICSLMYINHKLAYVTTKKDSNVEDIEFYALQRRKIITLLCICLLCFLVFHLDQMIVLMLYVLIVLLCAMLIEIILEFYRL